MENLLIFFALPLAIIIFSIALQKIFKCPPLVAGIIFSIGLIVTFIIGNLNYLVATLIYTLLSYLVAVLTCIIINIFDHMNCRTELNNNCCNNDGNNRQLLTISSRGNNTDLLTINSTCQNGDTNDLLTISSNCNGNCRCRRNNNNCGQDNTNCCNNSEEIVTTMNVIPNTANNGRTGCICGRYRRR